MGREEEEGKEGQARTIEEGLDGERDKFGEGKVNGHDDLSCGISWVTMRLLVFALALGSGWLLGKEEEGLGSDSGMASEARYL